MGYRRMLNDGHQDNVFFDSFTEVKELYADVAAKDVWEEASTIVLYDTEEYVGLFPKSDIIIVYDNDGQPAIITERIFRKNYTVRQWFYLKRSLRSKLHYVTSEFGFNISFTFGHGYIDYVHYKEEWWEWAKRQKLR